VQQSALSSSSDVATAESMMEPGPSTVRPNTSVADLVERLTKDDLRTAIVSTPGGRLIGVFHREDGERYLRDA
jgi:CBS domain-containing protein